MLEQEKKERKDYFQQVTNEIIAVMEKGNLPWQKPWDPKVGGILCPRPFNGKSGRAYTLDNGIRLAIVMDAKNSSDPRFFTFNQAKEKGWSVKKGAKAITVRQGFYVNKDRDGNNLPEEECYWDNKYIPVFHASDICVSQEYVKDENGKQVYEDVLDKNGKPVMVDDLDKNGNPKMEPAYDEDGQIILDDNGKPAKQAKKKPLCQPKINYTPIPEYVPKKTSIYTHEETMELAEAVLQNSGAKIQHKSGTEAYYERNADIINIPPKEAFPSLAGYYATALHELAHWTGHESRLNRPHHKTCRDSDYAKEELRAELASVYLSMELGVPVNTSQNAAYIQSWIKNLQDDKKEIINAMNDAMKIKNFVKDLAKEKIMEIVKAKKEQEKASETEIVKDIETGIIQEVPVAEVVNTPEKTDNEILKENIVDRVPDDSQPAKKEEVAKEPVEKEPELLPACLVITVFEPKNGELGKEFKFNMESKTFPQFKFNDFEKKNVEIAIDASSPEEYFAKHNTHVVGSLVQVDDDLFYMNKDNKFKRIYATNKDGELIISAAANPEKFQEKVIEKIGQEKFNDYKKNFIEMFRIGAAVENPDIAKENLDVAYQKFVYDNSIKFGLSSNNPIAVNQWKSANESFMQACVKEFGADLEIIKLVANTVKDICPLKVNSEELEKTIVNSKIFQEIKSMENNESQIAAYSVR